MEIIINWKDIESEDRFFEVFLPQVSAPEWHGRNLNALGDSIVTGDVNGIEPPYTIINKNINSVSGSLKEFQEKVFEVFQEAIDEEREIKVVSE
jgi:RNAse (barnase) inhibitor barstar